MCVEHLTDWQIQEYLYRNRSDSSINKVKIENHLKDCYLCRESLEHYNELSLDIEMCGDVKLSNNFTKKVMRKINHPIIVRVYESYGSIASSLALPLSLMISVLFLYNFNLLFAKTIATGMYSYYRIQAILKSIKLLLPSLPDLSGYLTPFENTAKSMSGNPEYFWIALLVSAILILVSTFDSVQATSKSR